jgi:hypothetical protein
MVKMAAIAFASFVLLSHDVNAQERGIIPKLENTYLLSKSKKSDSYSQIFKNYQIVIFAKIEDCSPCISENSPWIQMIRSDGIPTCFVVMNKSLRVAQYHYETLSLPFDFYCDTARAVTQLVGGKDTPIVLILNSAGNQIFFDNPLYEMKRFMSVINSVDTPGARKKW